MDKQEKPKASDAIQDNFRRILGLKADEEVPVQVIAYYHVFKKRADICSAGSVTAKDLIHIAMYAMQGTKK